MAEKAKYEVVDELIRGVGSKEKKSISNNRRGTLIEPPKNPVNLGIKYRTNSGARHYQVGYGSRKSSGDHREKGTDLLRGAKRRRLSGVPEQNPQPRGRVREIQNNLNGRGKRKSISVELGEGKFNNRNILNSIITDHKKSGEKEVQGRDEEKVKGNKVEKEQSIEVITESFTKSKEDPQPIAKIHDKRGIIKVYDLSTDSEEDEPGEGVINEDTMKDVKKNKGDEGEEEVTEIKETPLKESKNSADTTQKSELMEIIDTTSESASASESESGSKSEPELGSGFKSDSERDGDSFFSILKQDAAKSSNSCVGVAIKPKDSNTVVIGSRVEQKSSESIEIYKKSYEKQQSKGKSVQSNELEKRVEENLNIGPNKRELRRRTIGLAFPSHQPLVINRLKTKEQSTSKQVNSEDVTVMYKDRSTHNRMKGEMGPGVTEVHVQDRSRDFVSALRLKIRTAIIGGSKLSELEGTDAEINSFSHGYVLEVQMRDAKFVLLKDGKQLMDIPVKGLDVLDYSSVEEAVIIHMISNVDIVRARGQGGTSTNSEKKQNQNGGEEERREKKRTSSVRKIKIAFRMDMRNARTIDVVKSNKVLLYLQKMARGNLILGVLGEKTHNMLMDALKTNKELVAERRRRELVNERAKLGLGDNQQRVEQRKMHQEVVVIDNSVKIQEPSNKYVMPQTEERRMTEETAVSEKDARVNRTNVRRYSTRLSMSSAVPREKEKEKGEMGREIEKLITSTAIVEISPSKAAEKPEDVESSKKEKGGKEGEADSVLLKDDVEFGKQKSKTQTLFVYPPKGKNPIMVLRDDIYRLKEGEFLNDTVIEVYIKMLSEQLQSNNNTLFEECFFYSPFFYEQLDRYKKSYSKDEEENVVDAMLKQYGRVKRWTSKVDIFSKKYLFVPINKNLHWFLVIIVNPFKLKNYSKEQSSTIEEKTETMSDVNKGCSTNDTLERDKEDRNEQEEEEGNNNSSSGSSGDGDGDGDGGEDNGDEVDVNDINTASDTNKSGDTSNDINNSETTEGEQDEKKHKVYTIKELEQMTREGIESDKGAETDNGIGENEAGGKQNESEAKNSGKKEEKPAIYRNVNEKTWILVLDSLGGKHHGAVVKTLKKYLECMVLQSTIEPTDTTDTTDTTNITDTTNTGDTQSELHLKYTQHVKNSAKTVYAKVPLQPNMCDCGMFLLEYIERFLKNPEFFTLYMANRGNALSTWFPTSAIREKRSSMIKLFVKLTKEYIDGKKINLQK